MDELNNITKILLDMQDKYFKKLDEIEKRHIRLEIFLLFVILALFFYTLGGRW